MFVKYNLKEGQKKNTLTNNFCSVFLKMLFTKISWQVSLDFAS